MFIHVGINNFAQSAVDNLFLFCLYLQLPFTTYWLASLSSKQPFIDVMKFLDVYIDKFREIPRL